MSERLGAVKFGQESGEVFMGRDMGHGRDYSEEIAAQVDAEVRALVENAHHEAWEILVEYRDVLDDMVLRLLDKETIGKEEILEIFAPIDKRPPREHPTGNGRRPLSTRPPVLTPAELAVMGPADLEDLARGRTKAPVRRKAASLTKAAGAQLEKATRRRTGESNGGGEVAAEPVDGTPVDGVDGTPAPSPRPRAPRASSGGSVPMPGTTPVRRRRAAGTDPAS
jgi:cell division protease FtsH